MIGDYYKLQITNYKLRITGDAEDLPAGRRNGRRL